MTTASIISGNAGKQLLYLVIEQTYEGNIKNARILYDRLFFQPDFFHEFNISWFITQVLQTWFHLEVSYRT